MMAMILEEVWKRRIVALKWLLWVDTQAFLGGSYVGFAE